MKLFLAVPRQSGTTGSHTATRPAQTREWIARLPLLNARESLQQIHEALYGMNRTEMRSSQRLKVLDMFRSPLRVIRNQVETRLARGAAPLSGHELGLAEMFRECCIEMAYGYKAVILEIAQSRKRRRREEMRLSMARALFYLEQTVFACALYRQKPPEGIWQEIHTIFFYGRSMGITDDPVKESAVKARTSTTISLIYRRTLLFGLSDPFHQSVPLMGRVLWFLRKHAQNAALRDYAPPPTERCQFVIDPQSDYPARAYVKRSDEKPPSNALLLDTVNLTKHAHDQLKRLTSAEQLDVELDDEFKDDLGKKLLEEVVYAWGIIPRRGEERVAENRSGIEIVIGIDAVSFHVNGERSFQLSSTDHANGSRTIGGRHGTPPSGAESLACKVVDRAESGLRLSVPYDTATTGSLQIGDIVASRGEDDAWTPGLIRWLRCIEDVIEFGIKQLRQHSLAVAVKPVSSDRVDPFKAGLAIYPDENHALLQLITPPGSYRYQRNLFVDDGATLLMTRARRIIERSPITEWFECEKINL